MTKFDVLIIGAGINGLAATYYLSDLKDLKIGLVDQFALGHPHGSSHGFSRIFRTTYLNPVYINLARRAASHEWPFLEERLGGTFLHPNSRCMFGSGDLFEARVKAILNHHSDVEFELLNVSSARKRFPQFRFYDSRNVLLDHSSKVIAAKETMDKLAMAIRDRNVAIFDNTKVLKIISEAKEIKLETSNGPLSCNKLIIAAGPWVNQLLPDVKMQLCPIKQTVGYYQLGKSAERYQIGQFPNWVYFGEEKDDVFYGLPQFGCKGIKVVQEIMEGKRDDPNVIDSKQDRGRILALEKFIKKQFMDPFIKTEKIETCFYTSTPTEDFILDFLPQDHRILVGAACSGHAFKFAPVLGRILSELVLHGRTTISEFEANRQLFTLKFDGK